MHCKSYAVLYRSLIIFQDSEVLRVWLTDLRFEEYYDKFITAGYDMPTISRMTPEDLNAIGITKPAHRKKLKAEITRLNISDGLPDFIPVRIIEFCVIRKGKMEVLNQFFNFVCRFHIATTENRCVSIQYIRSISIGLHYY